MTKRTAIAKGKSGNAKPRNRKALKDLGQSTVELLPPPVFRVMFDVSRVDLLPGDSLLLTNKGGKLVITLRSGLQDVPVATLDVGTLSDWAEITIARVWGHQPLVVNAS